MNLKEINKKLLFDDRIVAIAGLTEPELEMLKWFRETLKKEQIPETNLTMPGNVAKIMNEMYRKLNEVFCQKPSFFGFEIVRQVGKEHFYIMDSSNKIVGRIQYVDDKV